MRQQKPGALPRSTASLPTQLTPSLHQPATWHHMYIDTAVHYQLGPSTTNNRNESAPRTTSSIARAVSSKFDWFMLDTLMRPLRSMCVWCLLPSVSHCCGVRGGKQKRPVNVRTAPHLSGVCILCVQGQKEGVVEGSPSTLSSANRTTSSRDQPVAPASLAAHPAVET